MVNPNPNSKTAKEGLSRLGIKNGTTKEAKKSWPKFSDKSESLSSCVFDNMGLTIINITWHKLISQEIFSCWFLLSLKFTKN